MASLTRCIAQLKTKAQRNLFRGLLMTAALEPQHVDDIDKDGWVLMTAKHETLATYAGVCERTLRRNRATLVARGELDYTPTVSSDAEWFFCLRDVLPDDAVGWFRELVENSKCHPDILKVSGCHFENVTLTKRPEVQNVTLTKGLTLGSFSSNGLALLKLSLAELGFAETEVIGERWETLVFPPSCLKSAAAVDALHRFAVSEGLMPHSDDTRRGVFLLAVRAAEEAASPVNWFRRAVLDRWDRDGTTRDDLWDAADALRAQIDGTDALPAMSAQQAFSEARRAIRDGRDAISDDVRAVASQVGWRRLRDMTPFNERELAREFAAYWRSYRTAQSLAGGELSESDEIIDSRAETVATAGERPEPTDESRRAFREHIAAMKARQEAKRYAMEGTAQ